MDLLYAPSESKRSKVCTTDNNNNTLSALLSVSGSKFVFVGGKGGVGKTSVSCAIAAHLARQRIKTLLLSTDPAHNLSDALGVALRSGEETRVNDFLTALEIDATKKLHDDVLNDEAVAGAAGGALDDLKKWIAEMPGIDEGVALSTLNYLAKNYDRVVIDTAPTGHTLRLLHLPEALQMGISKLESWDAKVGGFLTKLVGGDDQNQHLKEKLSYYKDKIQALADVFHDEKQCTFVCVCIAEFLSVFETTRLVRELRAQRVHCANIVVNQLVPFVFRDLSSAENARLIETLPATVRRACSLSASRAKIQQKYLQQLRDTFGTTLSIVLLPLEDFEIRGADALEKFSQHLIEPCDALAATSSSSSTATSGVVATDEEMRDTVAKLRNILEPNAAPIPAVAAPAPAPAPDPLPAVLRLLNAPGGISRLVAHPAVQEARASNPSLNLLFQDLQTQGPFAAFLRLTADPTLKPALQELLPKVGDLLQ